MAKENRILLYETADGETRLEVLYQDESVWLSQRDMADLLQVTIRNISGHINNIYAEGELAVDPTRKYFFRVQIEGGRRVSREIAHYNLDMIISVGYRVNSYRGTQFRIWATRQLREFIVKGFVMDDDRLAHGGSNYFEELEQRIRNIRSSEYNFYRKVLDVFATSIDYQASNAVAKKFFGTVQNKFHYAIHGHTAAELILERVGSDKLNMGLTTWKRDTMTLRDAYIAKNYPEFIELKRLNLLVEQFLAFAELQVVDMRPMYMTDWVKKLDQFIGELNEMPLLQNAGKVSRDAMKARVRKEYEAYRERLMLEEKLSEEEFARRLQDAGDKMLPPGDT
ncbi:MAG: virulence RhuM family protein [Chloroflexi bacterium]|nr:virulence RhuM family protein [Chloroflexota bacterium]